MPTLRRLFPALALCLPLAMFSQCENTVQFPEETITLAVTGDVTTIAECNYQQEYSHLTGILAGANYEFTATLGSYITVREGAVGGPVLGNGYGPLTITTTSASDLYVHWNVNDICSTGSGTCVVTTGQLILDCDRPTVTTSAVDDCENNTFSITVNISDLGDAGSLMLSYSANGDPNTIYGVVGVGEVVLGPFAQTDVVDILLEHDLDVLCNVLIEDVVSPALCPIIVDCSATLPLEQVYCYTQADSRQWLYNTSVPGQSLAMVFSAGTMEASWSDHLIIRNGSDASAPILFEHLEFNTLQLAGRTFIASSGSIYMEMTSDEFWGSCEDGNFEEWHWTVQCLDCQAATATFSVNTDCEAQQFTVDVNITNMGSDPEIVINNTGGVSASTATATGTYNVGPFPVGQPVWITLENDANDLCDLVSPALVNSFCPVVSCGPDNYVFCYHDGMDSLMTFVSTNEYPIAIIFNGGNIETCCDYYNFYDGPDQTATPIATNVNNGGDMAGYFVAGTGSALTVVFHSDGSVNCEDNGYNSMDFTVSCLDCTFPVVDYDVVLDCANSQFSVAVEVTALGTDPAMDLMNDAGAPPQNVTGPGTYTVGPFALGTVVNVSLMNDQNVLCSSYSGPLTNSVCPVISCGPTTYEFCYGDMMDSTMVFQSDSDFPIAVIFNSGGLETCCDYWNIYDGPDPSSPALATNLNNDGDMTDVFFASSQTSAGPQNALTLFFHSDGSVNCQDNSYAPMSFTVACLDCTNPEASYTVVPNCIQQTFSVELNVPNTGTSSTVRVANSLNTDTLENIPQGLSSIGPFPMNSTVVLTVMNATNDLCRVFSQPLTYSTSDCVIPSCQAAGYDYCYANGDTAWFVYQSSTNQPLSIGFDWGQLLVNDFIQIFDGFDASAPIIFMGNLGGNMSGFAINSTNSANAICMRIISNSNGSCLDGSAAGMYWTVECGEVGMGELGIGDFEMFPNPTNGQLFLRLPESVRSTVDLRVMDLTGRVVYQAPVSPVQNSTNVLELGALANGNYVVTVNGGDWVRTKQLQITH